jgi:outer membrane protein assembly factor BamB
MNGPISCLDAAEGKVIWWKDPYPGTVPKFLTGSSPIVVDGMAIAQFGGGDKGGILAFDLTSGDEKWRWEGDGADYSSPVLMEVEGGRHIVAMTSSNVVGIDARTGALIWKIAYAPSRMSYNSPTPIVSGQTVIYTAASRGTHAIKVVKKGEGYATENLWSNDEIGSKFSTPALRDGMLYGVSDRGSLFCMNAETGKTAWVGESQLDRGGYGAVVDTGSTMLVLSSGAELVAFKPDAKEYKELAKIKVAEAGTFAHPVIAGKRLYVKDEKSLSLLTIP